MDFAIARRLSIPSADTRQSQDTTSQVDTARYYYPVKHEVVSRPQSDVPDCLAPWPLPREDRVTPSAPDEAKPMTTTISAPKRPEETTAAAQPHAAPVVQSHASQAEHVAKGKGGPAASTKRPTPTQSQRGSTPAAKAQDANSSGGKRRVGPHAAPRQQAWDGGGTISSIFDAAGGGGARGLNVHDYPQLASMAVSPRKGDDPPTTGKEVESPCTVGNTWQQDCLANEGGTEDTM